MNGTTGHTPGDRSALGASGRGSGEARPALPGMLLACVAAGGVHQGLPHAGGLARTLHSAARMRAVTFSRASWLHALNTTRAKCSSPAADRARSLAHALAHAARSRRTNSALSFSSLPLPMSMKVGVRTTWGRAVAMRCSEPRNSWTVS
eukprot:1092093-Heterocapsa_arctica.AAC.1